MKTKKKKENLNLKKFLIAERKRYKNKIPSLRLMKVISSSYSDSDDLIFINAVITHKPECFSEILFVMYSKVAREMLFHFTKELNKVKEK